MSARVCVSCEGEHDEAKHHRRSTASTPSPVDPGFAEWLNGDLTRFCGHDMHDRCKGTISTIGIESPCKCHCHRADSPSPEGAEPQTEAGRRLLTSIGALSRAYTPNNRPWRDTILAIERESEEQGHFRGWHDALLDAKEREAALPEPSLDVERLARVLEEALPPFIEEVLFEYRRLDPAYQATLPTINDVLGILSEDRSARLRGTEGSQ